MKFAKFFILLSIVVTVLIPVALPDLVQAQSGVAIPSPIKCDNINCLISQVIRYILGTIAIVATLMFIWGGFMMLTSAGNAEQIKKAKETLAWAAIGIVVIMLSWAIIRFVLQGLINAQSPSTTAPKTVTGCCVFAPPDPQGTCNTTVATQCVSPDSFNPGASCSSLGVLCIPAGP